MLTFDTAAEIAATPTAVWDVLVDIARWPDWDSGVVEVTGSVAPGAKIAVRVAANPGRAFPVRVVELSSPSTMTWRGGMPLGLFTGTRTYRLTPSGVGCRFTMQEEYTGPLAGAIGRSIPDLQPSFDQFAAGLKARVEGGAAAD